MCTARNTSSIQWRSNIIKSDFVQCQRKDPLLHNVVVDGIAISVQTIYSADTTTLQCNLTIKAKELPPNHQEPHIYEFTCENVDIGVSQTDTLEVTGIRKLGIHTVKGQ